MTEFMKAGKFKAHCLKVMDRVKKTKRRIIITKRNVPVAQIAPVDDTAATSIFGKLKGTLHVKGNIIHPIEEKWDACH